MIAGKVNLLDCYAVATPVAVEQAVLITPLTPQAFLTWQVEQPTRVRQWLAVNQFTAKANTLCLIPDEQGQLQQVVCGYEKIDDFWALAYLFSMLPAGCYYLARETPQKLHEFAIITWGLACYRYQRYKMLSTPKEVKQLFLPAEDLACRINALVKSIHLVRDLINAPSEDMGPAELGETAEMLAQQYGGEITQVIGEELLAQNFPLIYSVGRASHRPPRLIDLQWGEQDHPRVTLVGKGVCFDSGGLDLKSSQSMRLMKKDMGGAAHVLGLAQLIMATQLPIRLRVLIPAVDNVIAGNAYRPGDVIVSRKGISVEIDNTDAEGRLILADALTLAYEDSPELVIDFATLTGAARVAVGTDLAAMFCNDDQISNSMQQMAGQVSDPLWPMPLYQPYQDLLKSSVADIVNSAASSYAGAITAALFLQRFINDAAKNWVHFDMMAWNLSMRPGRPDGGEAQGLRAVFQYLTQKYTRSSHS